MSDSLTCPKCGSPMRSYERNQVVVDQCTGCGGLFLDRGELEHLVQAESAFYAAPPATEPRRDDRPDPDLDRHQDDRRRDQRHDDPRKRKKKSKMSFLEDFLDF